MEPFFILIKHVEFAKIKLQKKNKNTLGDIIMKKINFENKCMDVIEQITSIDIKQNREGAIKVAEIMFEKAKATGKQNIIDIYERVVNEFKIATDEEYELGEARLV